MRLGNITSLTSVALLLITFSGGCIFSGGGKPTAAVSRPSSIPTATPPATLPSPLALGQSQAAGPPGATTGTSLGSTYTLQPGDTLFSVAAKLGVPSEQQAQWVADVLRLNGVGDATLLKAGQELNLPRLQPAPRPAGTVQGTAAARTPTAASTAVRATSVAATATPAQSAATSVAGPRPTAVTGGAGTYTVVAGDFPVQIAGKVGVPAAQQAAWADQLVALNNVSATGLQVGQVLQLPPIPKPN